jgi:hypothetical protein
MKKIDLLIEQIQSLLNEVQQRDEKNSVAKNILQSTTGNLYQ